MLDTETHTDAATGTGVAVNGPEDEILDWDAVDWRAVEDDVRRLRQRIFTASQAGDLAKVRDLQKLMLRSRANALVSVRRVAQVNAGRVTAGIDGRTALLSSQRAELAAWVQHGSARWSPKAVKRVYIPKANGNRRPLGIPVIKDRALQAMVLNALEPEWEARLGPRTYGFRPGRGCHDAIVAIHTTSRGKNAQRLWALDADLTAAFDRISHTYLLTQLGSFPARELVARWLAAGVVEDGHLAPTTEGTPQGGVISPLLLNIALHGMDLAAGVRYSTCGAGGAQVARTSPVLVVYRRYRVVLDTEQGPRRGLRVTVERDGARAPLVAQWGGITLARDITPRPLHDSPARIWSGRRSEVVQRLLADACELCGSGRQVEVHHVRALKDLNPKGRQNPPEWVVRMASRRRKTLVVCRACHEDIHAGRPTKRSR